jgi:putative DNA primase/helicase
MIDPSKFLQNGISIIPIDNNKMPAIGAWGEFQTRRMTELEASQAFRKSSVRGIGCVCGKVSGGLECLDFDMKHDKVHGKIYLEYAEKVRQERPALLAKMCIVSTKSGGFHWIYRSEAVEKGLHLARRPATEEEQKTDRSKVFILIETRGEGQYFATVPAHGYALIQGSIENPPDITAEERNYLHRIAMSYGTYYETPKASTRGYQLQLDENDPLSAFSREGDVMPYLIEAGWTVIEDKPEALILKRPGSSLSKMSAYFFKDNKIFYCFSTSTTFEANRGYNQAQVFAHLFHSDNYNLARRALADLGYGNMKSLVDPEYVKVLAKQSHRGAGELIEILSTNKRMYAAEEDGGIWYSYTNGVWMPDKQEGSLVSMLDEAVMVYEEVLPTVLHELDVLEAALPEKLDKKPKFTAQQLKELDELSDLDKEERLKKEGEFTQKQRDMERKKLQLEADKKALESQIKAHQEAFSAFNGILSFARRMPKLSTSGEFFNRQPNLINLINGVYDCVTGQFLEHDPEHLLTQQAPIVYDPAATCPNWIKFMDKTFGGDKELIEYIQQSIGYTFTGYVDQQVIWFAVGAGANGKSTFFNALRQLFGGYAATLPIETLLMSKSGGDREMRISLGMVLNRRFVVCTEMPEHGVLNQSVVKDLTGTDALAIRVLYKGYGNGLPTHKLWMFGNYKPIVAGDGHAIWRRIRLIPFSYTIPPEEQRPTSEMMAEFLAESSGILNWALEGLAAYMKAGQQLKTPRAVIEASEGYRDEANLFKVFFEQTLTKTPGQNVLLQTIFDHYKLHCYNTGDYQEFRSSRALADRLRELGFKVGNGAKNKVYVHDLQILDQSTPFS